ncbi:aldehyde dehydrogenase [Paenibacillus sp. 1011MAR3C5]|uniref:aldehyde dehydrogenase n=1 Tax=Paenibacillus sp. 1011MAR3C5 TaxID=1675787 RepID=UPI000E6B5C3E|nr:aldehyde dehydrogenase [Paenibacillus sp. 1011MAR3C5]RJE88521.1 aldehyde dehydrogenase [Paenibacillus sp. 1011MAR3C5]
MAANLGVTEMLEEHKQFFRSGMTADAAFRMEQLNKLKSAIVLYERDLLDALYKDLRKSETEAYGSEIGLVLGSISYMIKNLCKWMKPKRVRAPLHLFGTKSRIIPEPYGTVLIIGPFNYPVQLVLEPLLGAIAAGNCAVIKPSESSPHVSAVIARMIEDTFDKSYIRVVEGDKDITSALIHAPFDYIFFTGSGAVGKIVMEAAARNLVPVTLELGGKSPAIIDRTANLELAAKRIAWGKWMNAGQTCIAPDYLIVHESVKEPFARKLQEIIRSFYGDNPQASADYGRIINERQFDRLASILQHDQSRIAHGGRIDRDDLYIEPTLLDVGNAEDSRIEAASMEDELFGPLLPMLTYSDLEDAISQVRNRPKPLALYVFSEDRGVQDRVMGTLSFGGGCVNDTLSHIINHHLPFGGVGHSGIGGYHGKHSFDLFSHHKSVLKRSTRFEPGILFPPYEGKLKLFRKVLK